MKKLLYGSLVALCMVATSASADFYVGAGYGGAFNSGSVREHGVSSAYKDTPIYSLSGGIIMPIPLFDFRAEAEYLHIRPNTEKLGKKQLDAVMLNASAVIPFIPLIDPYVGFGIGYGRYDYTNTSAWQYLMGLEYSFETIPFVIGAEYRYFKLTDDCGKHSDKSKYHNNALMLKLKFVF